jgi:hypothetical protein
VSWLKERRLACNESRLIFDGVGGGFVRIVVVFG